MATASYTISRDVTHFRHGAFRGIQNDKVTASRSEAMDLSLLEDFLALADELNFSSAAQRRNMTQPAFSRRIRALEDWIGTPLLRRTSRSVSMTDEGRAFRPRAAEIVRDLKRAREEALESAGRAERSLTIAATHALSFTFVPRWMLQTVGHANFGSINLLSDSYESCEAMLVRGDAVFLIAHRGPDPMERLATKQFTSHDIGSDVLVPVTASGNDGKAIWELSFSAGGTPCPYLAYALPSGLGRILERHWEKLGQRPNLTHKFKSRLAATLHEMVREGQGVAWVPLSLAERDISSGALVRAGSADFDVPVAISLTRPSTPLSRHSERFWQAVKGKPS